MPGDSDDLPQRRAGLHRAFVAEQGGDEVTPSQLGLFEAPPTAGLSRRDDPRTSVVAAKSVDLAARKGEVLEAMRWIGVSCTADEISARLASYGIRMDPGSVRSRLNQLLKDDALVRKVGCKTVPKPLGSGRPSTTWALT